MDWLPGGWEAAAIKVAMAAVVIVLAVMAWRALQKALPDPEGDGQEHKAGLTIFKNILRVVIWVWALCAVADICFDVDMAGVIGALGIVGIAVSLGAQQTIANLIGGIIISLSPTVKPGDWAVIQGPKEGRLVDTNWRCTVLEDEDGIIYEVPNSVMVSSVVQKGHPFFTIIVPFALKTITPDVAGLLRECEGAVLDAQVSSGTDYQGMRPKAHIKGTSLGAIEAEVKLYANREFDTRSVERAVLPALVGLLQERDALAEDPGGWTRRSQA